MYLNVEIKAKCKDAVFVRKSLMEHGAQFKGVDEQTDTYFNVPNGRLKLREGNIENNLIYYDRPDQAGPKNSRFFLTRIEDNISLKRSLTESIGVKVIVAKKREIYYISNVKFHVDMVPQLGNFIEIEAGNVLSPELTEGELRQQCEYYMEQFRIDETDLVTASYSDMIMAL
jgi:adenylate cyclase class 2